MSERVTVRAGRTWQMHLPEVGGYRAVRQPSVEHQRLVQNGQFLGQGRDDPFDIWHQLAVGENAEVQPAYRSRSARLTRSR
jgi:hypothetical protein